MMNKSLLKMISGLLMFALSLCQITCVAESAVVSDTVLMAKVPEERIDRYETKSTFNDVKEWKTHLKTQNKNFSKNDLSHNRIQTVLKEKGTAGLSKYQYYQLLTEEKPTNYRLNEVLVCFDEGYQKFANEEFNLLFKSFENGSAYMRCILKESYTTESLLDLIGELIEDPNVALVQPNFIYKTAGFMSGMNYTYTMTQAMEQVAVPMAWDYSTGEGVVVGLIDTGVNRYGHQNIAAGSSDDCRLCDGHGTAVSTVVGGNEEFAGVAPDCEILCLGTHVHGETSEYTSFNIENCVSAFDSAGCKIINMSIGPLEEDGWRNQQDVIVTMAQEMSNALIVNSAGNCNIDLDNISGYTYYNSSNFICVAAVDRYDNLWYKNDIQGSNYGAETVHLAAPGVDLYLPASNGDNVIYWSGTSFAAPFVSGTAALLLSANPNLTAADLKNIILDSADYVPGLDGKVQGGRRLNVGEAVRTRNVSTGNRSAVITNDGVLKVIENGSSFRTIASGVKDVVLESGRVIYQLENNHIYYRNEDLSGSSIALDTTGNAVSFKASGLNLYIHHSDKKLYKYKYNESTEAYVSGGNFTSIKYYAIRGNRLVLVYTGLPKEIRVFENAYRKTSSANGVLAYKRYSVGSDITAVYMFGSRIHVFQSGGAYSLFDSIVLTNGKEVYEDAPAEMDIVFNMTGVSSASMNETIWCCVANGNTISLHRFHPTGYNRPNPTIIPSPSGANITSCLVEKNKVHYLSGGVLYCATGANTSSTTITGNVTSYGIKGSRIGILNTSGTFYQKYTATNQGWVSMHTNVKKLVLGS